MTCLIVAWLVVLAPAHLYLSRVKLLGDPPSATHITAFFWAMGPQKPPRMHIRALSSHHQTEHHDLATESSHTLERHPALHPYTPTPPTMPSYSRCASIKSSEDPSWKRLQTSSRNPVSSGQWMDLANFQSHIMRSRLCKVLNCRNCIPWPSTSVSNIELGDEMNRDRHHNNLDAVSTRTWKEWTCQVVFSVWHLAGNLIKA